MNTGDNEPLNILLVESRSERSNLVRRLLADGQIVGRLHTVGCSTEALAYLRRNAPYLSAPSPDFVLLGQCAPGSCGCDFLTEIGRNARLIHTQLIALADVQAEGGASLRADCCGLEPVNPSVLANTISRRGRPGVDRS